MSDNQIFQSIKHALDTAPRKDYTAELHVQIIKHAERLHDVAAEDFCNGVGIPVSYRTEFAKMRKIATRLRHAGLDPARI